MGDPSQAPVVRGGIYPVMSIRRGHFLVVSPDEFTHRAGLAIVIEVVEQEPPEDVRSLVAVQLGGQDPLPGWWVLCWRINWLRVDRLDAGSSPGRVSPATMERVENAIVALIRR